MTSAAPAIPRAAARELDRLSRAAHRFHRFAHHPLCEGYAGEVIRVGRKTRICRGCTCAAAGVVLGVCGAVAAPVPPPALVLSGLAVGALVGLLSLEVGRGTTGWVAKLVSRTLPAQALAFTVAAGVRLGGARALGLVVLAMVLLGGTIALYRGRQPDRSPCAACPERGLPTPCRGLRPIVRRERAFQRRASSLVSAAIRPDAAVGSAARSAAHG